MPTDAERWRFLADHKLTLHTDGGPYLVHWCRTVGPGEPPTFYPVSNGRTAEEAIDRAIDRVALRQVLPARRRGRLRDQVVEMAVVIDALHPVRVVRRSRHADDGVQRRSDSQADRAVDVGDSSEG